MIIKSKDESRVLANSHEKHAVELEALGLFNEADLAYKAAALIDLADDELQDGWGGALNGQVGRQKILKEIINAWNPSALIETGTFRGITTEWLAELSNLPIYTCEKNKRYYFQAKARLEKFTNVNISLTDSREHLRQLAELPLSQERCLIYLDAHWEEDLPLQEEITIIFAAFKNPLVIVDDFRVPFDFGYKYDDYGDEKIISISLLDNILPQDVRVGFPSLHSSLETGARRGCALFAHESTMNQIQLNALVCSDTLINWKLKEHRTFELEFRSLANRNVELENLSTEDGTSKMRAQIDDLTFQCEERLKQIITLNDLNKQLQEKMRLSTKDDTSNIIAQIDDLTFQCEERLKQIITLTDLNKQLQEKMKYEE